MFGQFEVLTAVDDRARNALMLLQAHIASFVDGLRHGHISRDSGREVRRQLARTLTRTGIIDHALTRVAADVEAETLWLQFKAAVTEVGDLHCSTTKRPHKLADTRRADTAYASAAIVSISPLHHHADLINKGAKKLGWPDLETVTKDDIAAMDADELAQCAECLLAAIRNRRQAKRFLLKQNATDTVWIAPITGDIPDLVDDAHGKTLTQDQISRLRDLLGLWREDGRKGRPLAAFFLDARSDLYAPNVITAAGYERFRHRPDALIAADPTAGLTYNLNRLWAVTAPGAAEVVSVAVNFAEISHVIACDPLRPFDTSPSAVKAAHKTFADDVTAKRPFGILLRDLDTALA